MLNWLYFKIAMYYMGKAKRTPAQDVEQWNKHSTKSMQWIKRLS